MNVKATSLISHTQVQMGLAIYYSEKKKINYNNTLMKKSTSDPCDVVIQWFAVMPAVGFCSSFYTHLLLALLN